ncbi:N-acetylmuramoyl-L-alanine amidase family protein [Flammeovirga aprica]|uniref:N-acetylmuramoyl-L-alanine amidase n=1 Tax=Flammeovirga aprica JL-4 TaxID=694437 RepID=A0A7X9S0L6_9BACT|nr:N-acetylmuramoyl-L-alanine amidase [Flammeovirga aprica]NME71962.1 N-acetylmuramoyl-L-alanine amidase [Flammeovirga aprica JL-4]
METLKKLSTAIFITLILFTLSSMTSIVNAQSKKTYVVVIDPGHGGKDPGKPRGSSAYMHEKDINLRIAKKIGLLMRQHMPNVQVYYTRTSDKYVSLEDRVDFAEVAQADYFLSIHSNSNPNKWIVGAKAHVDTDQDQVSVALAKVLLNSIEKKTLIQSRGMMNRNDRGYNLYVLKNTSMPSVLIECGFLSNPYERKYINSKEGQNEIANAIFQGFQSFHGQSSTPQGDNYSIQILATNKRVTNTNPHFQKLLNQGHLIKEHEIIRNNKKIYKYTVGNVPTTETAQSLKLRIRRLGFTDAFVVKMP